MMMSSLRSIVGCLLLASPISALQHDYMLLDVENKAVISLQEAIRLALARNDELRKIEQEMLMAGAETGVQVARLLPKLSAVASHETFDVEKKERDENLRAGLKLEMPLLDVKLFTDVRAKRQMHALAKDRYAHQQDVVINEVSGLYIEALIAENSKNIAHEEIMELEEEVSSQKRRKASTLDITRAQLFARRADTDYLVKTQDYEKQMGELGKYIGMHEMFSLEPVAINSKYLDMSREELIDLAQNTLDISMAKREVAHARSALLSEGFDFFPKLSAHIDTGWQFPYTSSVMSSRGDFSTRIMFNAEFNLFNGGGSFFGIRGKQAARTISEINLTSRTKEKTLSVIGLKRQLEQLEKIKANSIRTVEAAEKARKSADRLGLSSEIVGRERSEAITNLKTAEIDLQSATLRLEHAKIRLLFTIGKAKEIL